MRVPFLLTILLSLCGLLAGCLPESKNPLSSPSASVVDSRLEGVYTQREKEKKDDANFSHFHYRGVSPTGGGLARRTPWLEILTVEAANDGGLKTLRYEALTTRLGGRDYLSFMEVGAGGAKKQPLPYSFARYEVDWLGDLHIWIANDSAFAAAIKAGKLRGKVSHGRFGDSVEITDTTEHLAAFVAGSDPKVLFSGKPMVMRRITR